MVGERAYVVDFGAGVVRQIATFTIEYGGPPATLDVKNLTTAFFTHLHSDHIIGYPDLILTPWVMGRDRPLEVYGPNGIADMTAHVLKAYQADIKYRLYGLERANNYGWRVNTHEISEGVVYEDATVKVEAFLVKHGTWRNAYGYRFTTPDKVIVISGDTAPCETIINYAQGADILIHEVYYKQALDAKSDAWKAYQVVRIN